MKEVRQMPYTKKEAVAIWKQWKDENQMKYWAIRTFCSNCGGKENLQVHHNDGDKTHNDRDNLECLCNVCHLKFHNKEFVLAYLPEPKKDVPIIPIESYLGRRRRPKWLSHLSD